ncbi:hypothetical protein NUU61_002604 [Penicillium alfredii]|uniref:alpha-1,2-Mannosidase n=1 Tax=Penicillium alfredii TaxID=1506179 RepID=A0A9W9KHE7_9EURO|nr:uncharacterized protein NUU61_002604 [Penicillium alfredii]KAJ5105257.1 hypothetical protein NUU61_002604 [Penicillium alfredii]
MFFNRKGRPIAKAIVFVCVVYFLFVWFPRSSPAPVKQQKRPGKPISRKDPEPPKDAVHLTKHPELNPVPAHIPLPNGPGSIPRIQFDFPPESPEDRTERVRKQEAVKSAFLHAWNGYKDHAWLRDEVAPTSGQFEDTFSGWGATLVDSLDALVIMGLDDELELALEALNEIDFTTTTSREVNVFEIVIRYMGGFLAAHDLTNGKHPILLKKAVELGEMIFNAFDTPNRMPQMRWNWAKSARGEGIWASPRTSLAEIASLTVEFTRLTQLTKDPKYFDAVQRITNNLQEGQATTRLPGMWPTFINAEKLRFEDTSFSVGGCADSAYEYFPKEHILLGGKTDQYQKMYADAIETIKKKVIFRAMTKDADRRALFAADVYVLRGGDSQSLRYAPDHLKCFMGGMVALGAKVFNRPDDMPIARGLTDGCVWAYDVTPTGVMPESFRVSACENIDVCPWDQNKWFADIIGRHIELDEERQRAQQKVDAQRLPPGITDIRDPSYSLRPEALESLFIMYRITGDKSLQDAAWRMFQNIEKATRTKFGHSSIADVRDKEPKLKDKMESFWLAETLKYLYLIFSEPNHISLDEYVLSTEAHPFKRPTGPS